MTIYKKSDGGKSDLISCHPLLWKHIWKDPGDDANCEYCFPWTNIVLQNSKVNSVSSCQSSL